MQEVETRARLVDLNGGSLAERGPTAVVPRSEIEEVINRGEYPARLVLDVARAGGEGNADVTAHAQVAVDWDKPELEELLRNAADEGVTLSFDSDELQQLLEDPDVDAHGLREKAAALGIVIATAGAATGSAFAHTQGDIGGGGSATGQPASSFVSDVGMGGSGTAAPSFVTDVRGGTGEPTAAPATGAPSSFVTDVRGGTGAPEGVPGFVSDVQGGTGQATPEAAPSFVTDVRGGTGGEPAAAPEGTSFVTDVQGGTGQPAGVSGLVSDVQGGTGQPEGVPGFVSDVRGGTGEPASTPSGGIEISMPSPSETAGLAGIALLITGAGFVAARSRRDRPQPA